MDAIWQGALAELREQLGKQNFETWIKPIRFNEQKGNEIRLDVPNKFFRDWLMDHFVESIEQVLQSIARHEVRVCLTVNENLQSKDLPVRGERKIDREHERPQRANNNLIAKYTFDNFVVGASNQFAHAASKAVASQPGDHYNPLFIYGGVGLGKTHLVNAIGHEILERNSIARIAYLSSEAFMNELISSLRRDRMGQFKDRFRKVDVLILDDVQLLAGRERTQEEFFHTFNTLYDHRRQIVLTSDKVPKDIPDLEERLRNRFEWGLIADIQAPDVETRVAIIEKKAEAEGIPLAHEVALFLGTELGSNVRELEGSLTRLGAYASINRCPITVDFARDVLQTVLKPRLPTVTYDDIANAVCNHFSLRPGDLRSKRRSKN